MTAASCWTERSWSYTSLDIILKHGFKLGLIKVDALDCRRSSIVIGELLCIFRLVQYSTKRFAASGYFVAAEILNARINVDAQTVNAASIEGWVIGTWQTEDPVALTISGYAKVPEKNMAALPFAKSAMACSWPVPQVIFLAILAKLHNGLAHLAELLGVGSCRPSCCNVFKQSYRIFQHGCAGAVTELANRPYILIRECKRCDIGCF